MGQYVVKLNNHFYKQILAHSNMPQLFVSLSWTFYYLCGTDLRCKNPIWSFFRKTAI